MDDVCDDLSQDVALAQAKARLLGEMCANTPQEIKDGVQNGTNWEAVAQVLAKMTREDLITLVSRCGLTQNQTLINRASRPNLAEMLNQEVFKIGLPAAPDSGSGTTENGSRA